jgi:hypothetical protein
MPHHIGLIVTGADALKDFEVFVRTLEVWHPDACLYVYTDSKTSFETIKFKGTMRTLVGLDIYTGKTRQEMEAIPGNFYKTLWTDFMYEKATVLEWMFNTKALSEGAWFLDADITFLAPLPAIPSTATVALSPHYIRTMDEAKYGHYNGGFLWFKDSSMLNAWREAGHTARFYEQSALEEVAKVAVNLYEFPIQVNFGWWRMFQAAQSPPDIQSKFSLFRADKGIGIRYDGAPLQSIHTHWYQNDRSPTGAFNAWIRAFVERYVIHKPMANFKKHIAV